MKITAAVFEGAGQRLDVTELELDPPREGEVRVKMMASGLCRSDYHVINGDWTLTPPMVLGHEGAGIVDEVGPGVTSVRVGDHVVLSWTPYCGHCFYCLTGHPALCLNERETGAKDLMEDGTNRLHRGDGREVTAYSACGTFATYTVVSETAAVPIDKAVPFEIAAVIGCAVATGTGAVWNTARVAPGDVVVVAGCGGVGLSAIAAARAAGARQVIAADTNPGALDIARAFGATDLVDLAQERLDDAVLGLTGREGADAAFDTVGLTQVMEPALAAVRPGGALFLVGMPREGTKLSIDVLPVIRREKSVRGSWYGTSRPAVDFPRIAQMYLAGRLNLDALIGKSIPLIEINEGFEELSRGAKGRIVIRFA